VIPPGPATFQEPHRHPRVKRCGEQDLLEEVEGDAAGAGAGQEPTPRCHEAQRDALDVLVGPCSPIDIATFAGEGGRVEHHEVESLASAHAMPEILRDIGTDEICIGGRQVVEKASLPGEFQRTGGSIHRHDTDGAAGQGVGAEGAGVGVALQNGAPLGEAPDDPVFTILDLLPHLSRKAQGEKKLSDAFEAEKLNVLLGSLPLGPDEVKDRFKLALLNLLYDRYGLVEEDFLTAELEVVPAGPARDVGLDRSLIGAYGHDDRVCVFTAAAALFETKNPRHGALALFFDKEEIGSEGKTSARSRFLETVVEEILEASGVEPTARNVRQCLFASRALSGDVNCALDPDYQDVHEKQNAARLGYGVCVTKFTGSGGKYGANDASAEYLGQIRTLFDLHKVVWQTGELGKVDAGGGGTIAKFLAAVGMEIVDCGTPVLSMHSPFEIVSKADVYMTLMAYAAFFQGAGPLE